MSGSTIGGIVGGIIGFWLGGPAGASVGWMIGSAAGGYLDPTVIEGPKLTDPQQVTASEGVPIPLVYGMAAVGGNVIQVQSTPTRHTHKQKQGKGGGPVQKTYTYTRTVAISICRAAPLNGEMKLRRAWMNGKLAYDASGSGQIDGDSAQFLAGLKFYSGSETQLPDADLEALPVQDGGGVGNVPAYRGLCYVVLPNLDVTTTGGAVPQFRFEVTSCGAEVVTSPDFDHGSTPVRQTNFDRAISDAGTVMVAGWNGNLCRSSGGTSWSVIDYGAQLGWLPFDGLYAIRNIWWVGGSTWYMARPNQVAVSNNDGVSWGIHNTPLYTINQSSVGIVAGVAWAGCPTPSGHGSNTCIFQPLATTDSLVDLGVAAGLAVTIDECNGVRYVGTSSGSIIRGTTVVETVAASDPTQFACIGNTIIAAREGGYSYSTDNGLTFTYTVSMQMLGVVVWAGNFYAVTNAAVLRSATGLPGSWTSVDSYFATYPSDVNVCVSNAGFFAITQDGSKTVSYIPGHGGVAMPDLLGYFVDLLTGDVRGPGLTAVSACQIPLDEMVGDLIERATIADYDVSALSALDVRGLAITQPTTPGAVIDELRKVYFFDLAEWGNSGDTYPKLRAVLRGGPSVLDLSDDDLVDVDDDEDTRAQHVEFPRKLNFVAPDPDHNYEPITQTAERASENIKAASEATFTTAVVHTRDEAAQKAHVMLGVLWEEAAGRSVCTVPEAFTGYVPSDIITRNGRRLRLDRCEQQDGQSRWELTRDRASAYSSTVVGSTSSPPPVSSSLRGPTMFQALNLVDLTSTDNVPGLYIAVCGVLPNWAGCDLYLSVDGGATESLVTTITDASTMGVLTADLTVGGSTLSVQVYNDDELDSVTPTQLAQRMNAFAVTTDSVSEVLQAQTATDTGTKTYDLTDLTRALNETTEVLHNAGDSFALLDGSLTFLPLDESLAGTVLIFRPVTRGTTISSNPTYSVLYDPATFIIVDGNGNDGGDTQGPTPGSGGAGSPGSPTARTHGTTVVDPVTYGADPTGVSDSTAAFNNAYAALPGGGGIVRPSAGTYKINPVTSIKPRSSTRLDLATNNVTLQASYTATDHTYVVWLDGVTNVEIVGGHIKGYRDSWSAISGTTSEWGHCIFANNSTSAVTIRDCTLEKAVGDAVSLGYSCSDVWIDNCTLTNCRRQGVSSGADNIKITNCEISYISGTAPQAGIDIEPDAPATSNTTLIDGNHIHHCTGPSVQCYKRGNDVTVTNNTLEYCNRGVYSVDSTGGVVQSNTIRYHKNSGVYLKGTSTGWTIGGTGHENAFYGNKTSTYGTPPAGGGISTVTGQSTLTAKHLTLDSTASATVGANTYGPT